MRPASAYGCDDVDHFKRERKMKYYALIAAALLATPAAAKQPATPVVIEPQPAIDGSMYPAPVSKSVLLFGGITPPNGFSLGTISGQFCFVNDHGPAGDGIGFVFGPGGSFTYTTPPGYKPMGPVSIYCLDLSEPSVPPPITARAW
jgi:hypothetical protein